MKRKTVVFLEPGKTGNQKPTSTLEIEILLAGISEPWTGIAQRLQHMRRALKIQETEPVRPTACAVTWQAASVQCHLEENPGCRHRFTGSRGAQGIGVEVSEQPHLPV